MLKLGLTNMSHYNDVIMDAMASQITSLTIVYSTVYSGAGQRKHQRSVSLAFVRRIHRRQVNSPHKWPVTRKMFPFDDVIMIGIKLNANISPLGLSGMSRNMFIPLELCWYLAGFRIALQQWHVKYIWYPTCNSCFVISIKKKCITKRKLL